MYNYTIKYYGKRRDEWLLHRIFFLCHIHLQFANSFSCVLKVVRQMGCFLCILDHFHSQPWILLTFWNKHSSMGIHIPKWALSTLVLDDSKQSLELKKASSIPTISHHIPSSPHEFWYPLVSSRPTWKKSASHWIHVAWWTKSEEPVDIPKIPFKVSQCFNMVLTIPTKQKWPNWLTDSTDPPADARHSPWSGPFRWSWENLRSCCMGNIKRCHFGQENPPPKKQQYMIQLQKMRFAFDGFEKPIWDCWHWQLMKRRKSCSIRWLHLSFTYMFSWYPWQQ